MRLSFLFIISMTISACGSIPEPCPPPAGSDVVYIVEGGWHAEIGIPVEELNEDLAFYRKEFPGARVLMFGYGKQTFFTAPPDAVSEYVLGPFPGPAVIHVVGLRVTPPEAYPLESTVTLGLPRGGVRTLSAALWKELAKDAVGKPWVVAHSTDPDGLFYAAQSEYNLFHTCNTWTADILHEAGLPISSDNVIFSGQVMSQVHDAAQNECRTLR